MSMQTIHQLSGVELRRQFVEGQISAVEIVQQMLGRIERNDGQVGAFLVVLRERALARAEALDAKRRRGEPLGRLAGVPVAIKDNMHILGELTTCGSRFLTNYRAVFDSTVVSRIEAEDGLLIGKTNCDEFAMGSSTENSALQKTCNPWALHCTPGGSSGGSSAAVAARMAPIALGSDTGGSIRQPAALCGIVGFKPTYGRVSRSGLVAFGSSLDVIGPLAHCVADVGMMMEVIGAPCERDSTSLPDAPEAYLSRLTGSLEGLTIGVPWRFLDQLASEPRAHFDASLEVAKGLGARIIEVDLDLLRTGLAVYYVIAPAEASTNLARFDGVRYGQRSKAATTLEEVYDFSKEEGFGPEVKRRILLGTFVLASGYQDAYYKQAQRVRTLIIRRFQEAFLQCDLIAMPTAPATAFPLGAIQDPLQMYLNDIYTLPANLAGLPAISVPSGLGSDGLPYGLQLMGPQRGDVLVCLAAAAFERIVGTFAPKELS